MWFSFWRSRDRYSLSELRYLIDQLQKVQIVNEVNKDFVIEALRSVAELITYGDQHDSSFFEVFMEKQVMGEFVRLLNINKAVSVSLQLLQSMGIIIQNLKSEHAIYYIFSNEHINYLITYSFDFSNEELLSYYISFLRAISGKLNKNTISLLVKTHDDEVIYFPLYVEAIRFAFHEENMIRTAVRALTLNVYHVGDNCVNKYITSPPHADYFSNLVTFFCEQCIALNGLVSDTSKNLCSESYSHIFPAVDEIEDNLYYFSDIISAGIPDVGRLITDCMLQLLIFPLLLPPLSMETMEGTQISIVTSLYLLCSILRIVKIKDMANAVAASFFCRPAAFVSNSEAKLNGLGHGSRGWSIDTSHMLMRSCNLSVTIPNSYSSTEIRPKYISKALRDALLSYIATGDDAQVFASLSMLATLLQTKELDESMLDALGILPERKQHKKLLLQALVGELSGEEQLFSSENSSLRDGTNSELDAYLLQLKNRYGISCSLAEVGGSPQMHRFEVVDVLVGLLCRSSVSADTLWDGGWLLRQLLPYSQAEFKSDHLQMLKGAYKKCIVGLLHEVKGVWPDFLLTVLCDEWKKCKRAVEASSLQREPKCVFFPLQRPCFEEVATAESSTAAAERMWELVKVFVLLHQLQIFILGRSLSELPPINPPISVPENFRAKTAGLDPLGPKSGAELSLVDALPCRIAFERGKERHFCFLAVALGTSGWLVLADELPLKQHYGVVRVAAPLAGSDPKIDEHHSKWLHLRIRPSTSPFLETIKFEAKGRAKTRTLVDGRWTLAFRNEESCKSAMSMILEEIKVQSSVVERSLRPLFDLEYDMNLSDSSSSSSSSLPFKTIS